MQPDPNAQAGHAIRDRRQDLGLKQSEAADIAGVSRATWMRAEKGDKRLSGATVGAMMAALGWTRDSYQNLVAGQEPAPALVSGDTSRLDELEAKVERLSQRIDELEGASDEIADIRATLRTVLNLR